MTLKASTAPSFASAAVTTNPTVLVSLQCSEGRYELPFDSETLLREVKRSFKQAYAQLANVNMRAYAVSHKGVFARDDAATLRSIGATDNSTLFLVKRRDIDPPPPVHD